jgi:hypothetical protein
MKTAPKTWLPLLLALLASPGCRETPTQSTAAPIASRQSKSDVPPDESQYRVVVNADSQLGPVMRLARASTHSTSSPLPGEATRAYMQSLDHDVVRTWIQTRYVYNKGAIDYNYKYESSDVGAEDALRFYATTGKSVLIALSAYNATAAWPLPTGAAFEQFLTQTLVYYKSRYPNVRYVQVGNEPDANDETMATYYPIYRQYYRAVNAANAELGLTGDDRILISNGPFTSNVTNMIRYAEPFFAAFAADADPDKKLDFFSFHVYGETDRPLELLTARQRIDAAMQARGLPAIPVFVSEYGVFGGSSLPVRFTRAELVTLQPAGQLTKAFYLYEGGVDRVFNWAIFHSSLQMKSQVADVQTAVRYPYGNALLLAKELSDRGTRIAASSKAIDAKGLGTHVLASMDKDGIAILVWNFNWRLTTPAPKEFSILVKNIPRSVVGGGTMRQTVYMIDPKTNNVYVNPAQTTLEPTSSEDVDVDSTLRIPMQMEPYSVALVVLSKKKLKCEKDLAKDTALPGLCE